MSGRRGGRVLRDLEDAAEGYDRPQPFQDSPEARAEAAYAHRTGRYRPGLRAPWGSAGGEVATLDGLGAGPDTILDDHREDVDL